MLCGACLDEELLDSVLEVRELRLELRLFVHEDRASNDRP